MDLVSLSVEHAIWLVRAWEGDAGREVGSVFDGDDGFDGGVLKNGVRELQ